MFSRVWPLGLGFGLPVASAALTQLDINVANAVDGTGGTYGPTTRIVVGGLLATPFEVQGNFLTSGLTVTGTSQFGGAAFTGAVIFAAATTFQPAATLAINSAATFGAAAVFSFGFAVNAASLFTANATFNVGPTFAGTPLFTGTPAFTNGASFTTGGSLIVGAAVGFGLQAATTNTGVFSSSGVGRVVPRPSFVYTDADQQIGLTSGTVAANGADCVVVNNGSITAGRTCTLLNAGATAGSRIRLHTYDDAHALTVQTETGVIIARLKSGTVAAGGVKGAPPAGFWNWIELEFFAANGWYVVGGQSA